MSGLSRESPPLAHWRSRLEEEAAFPTPINVAPPYYAAQRARWRRRKRSHSVRGPVPHANPDSALTRSLVSWLAFWSRIRPRLQEGFFVVPKLASSSE